MLPAALVLRYRTEPSSRCSSKSCSARSPCSFHLDATSTSDPLLAAHECADLLSSTHRSSHCPWRLSGPCRLKRRTCGHHLGYRHEDCQSLLSGGVVFLRELTCFVLQLLHTKVHADDRVVPMIVIRPSRRLLANPHQTNVANVYLQRLAGQRF